MIARRSLFRCAARRRESLAGSGEQDTIPRPDWIVPVLLPPGFFRWLGRREPQRNYLEALVFGVFLHGAEPVVIVEPHRLDHVAGRYRSVFDHHQVLAVLLIGGLRKIIRAKVHPGVSGVEIDHDKFVVHARAAMLPLVAGEPGWLGAERRGDVAG